MKRQILLLAITAAALSSCTTAYKTGQTPDDVYFSPTRPQDEYVRVKEKEDYRYQYDEQYYDDRYLRMKVHNPSQWSSLDDWYSYDRYGYRANSYYGTYYNPYTSWNYYYNPYCHNNVIAYQVGHPGGQVSVAQNVIRPKNFNLASYTNINNYNNANNSVKMNSYKTGMTIPVYNNRNSNNGFSNTLKQIFNTGSNNNSDNSSYSSPSRSYSPSSSSSSSGGSSGSSGSSSGGGGGATRPSRGGN
jgi:uncharacterized membrane protein YgcG